MLLLYVFIIIFIKGRNLTVFIITQYTYNNGKKIVITNVYFF